MRFQQRDNFYFDFDSIEWFEKSLRSKTHDSYTVLVGFKSGYIYDWKADTEEDADAFVAMIKRKLIF